jgi:AcrR family transcriptional regulator
LPQRSQIVLEPRKSPVQARSTASVDAILEATIQVLLLVGKERLTTTKVAARAGVSVGTLYQYFPNKSALLQAVLKRHMDDVTRAVELVCKEHHGRTLREMMTALMSTFLEAKMKEVKTSVALYSVSSDVDGAKIVQQTGVRTNKAIVRMLETAYEPLTIDPQLVASMLQGAMVGVSRRLLESGAAERQFESMREELVFLACAYFVILMLLAVGGFCAMFAEVVAVEEGLRDAFVVRDQSQGVVGHFGDGFEDYCVVGGVVGVLAPAEGGVAVDEAGRDGEGVDFLLFEVVDDG